MVLELAHPVNEFLVCHRLMLDVAALGWDWN